MPIKDPAKRRAAMKKWRDENQLSILDYNENRRPARTYTPEALDAKHARRRTEYRENKGPITFIGCDGEGMGDGSDHDFYVWRMGENQLLTGEPLTTEQCLYFIAEQDPGPIYTIFSGNYDFTMILRGLPEEVARDLLNRKARESDAENGYVRPTQWGDLFIDYIPHKRLSVRLRGKPAIVIHDVFGFFQSSFVAAIEEWNVGTPEERDLIAAGKERRGDSDVRSEVEQEYNRIECKVLSELMHEFHSTVDSIGLTCAPYEGAGALASSLMKIHYTKPVKERNRHASDGEKEALFTSELDPATFGLPTWDAYYGGRFEITAHGPIHAPVYEYDINSAYPAAIRILPCLQHGTWRRGSSTGRDRRDPIRALLEGRLVLGYIEWKLPPTENFGPLPHRNRNGNVTFPLTGAGWYWSIEWPKDEGTYVVRDVWEFQATCEHHPFSWVYDRYQQRRAHKEAGRKGQAMALKLGYNSLYGKMAQTIGRAPWRNSAYAGLTTALCRRWIRDAAEQNPQSAVMFATDGLYTLEPLNLPIGSDLGQWESAEFPEGLHLVRPGIYFSHDGEAKIKTRGISRKTVQAYAPEIVRAFDQIFEHPEWLTSITGKGIEQWGTDIVYNGLISIRLAYSQNRPGKAGFFGSLPHRMSYDIGPKRMPLDLEKFDGNWRDGILRSAPPVLGLPFASVGYRKGKELAADDTAEAVLSAPEMADTAPIQLELV